MAQSEKPQINVTSSSSPVAASIKKTGLSELSTPVPNTQKPLAIINASSVSSSTPTPYQHGDSMECYRSSNEAASTIVVCAIKAPGTMYITTAVSALALFISLFSIWYGFRKDKKASYNAIEDDYWFRTVVSPLALEPLIKKINEIISDIPEDINSADFDAVTCDEFGRKVQSDLVQLSSSITALALLNNNLQNSIRDRVSSIEDAVIGYCSNNLEGKIGADGGYITKVELHGAIMSEMLNITSQIKQYQNSKFQ